MEPFVMGISTAFAARNRGSSTGPSASSASSLPDHHFSRIWPSRASVLVETMSAKARSRSQSALNAGRNRDGSC